MTTSQIEAKVKARNRVNSLALEWAPKLFVAVTPFLNQKVEKVTGGFTQKFKAVLPELPCNPQVFININALRYSLKVNFKVSEMESEHACVYSEATVYLADLTDGVITRLYDAPKASNFRTDYTVNEILSLQSEIRNAESALSSLQSKMGTFAG